MTTGGFKNTVKFSFYALDIDDCTPNPCQNGGTCTDGVDSYNCTCAAGFKGTNCGISEFRVVFMFFTAIVMSLVSTMYQNCSLKGVYP